MGHSCTVGVGFDAADAFQRCHSHVCRLPDFFAAAKIAHLFALVSARPLAVCEGVLANSGVPKRLRRTLEGLLAESVLVSCAGVRLPSLACFASRVTALGSQSVCGGCGWQT